MQRLGASVHDALEGIGFARDERGFHPHITLARLRHPRALSLPHIRVEPVAVPVDRVVVFESHLGGPRPARYEALATVPLRGN